MAHGQNQGPKPPGWKRPFVETASAQRKPIQSVVKETVEFPEKDESVGELLIDFLGPHPSAFLERKVYIIILRFRAVMTFGQALDILSTYLTSSAVAPLNKEFVEVENPLWCVYNLISFHELTIHCNLVHTFTLVKTPAPHTSTCLCTSDPFRPSISTRSTRS